MRCYFCDQNTNPTPAGKPSCIPEPNDCHGNKTHCLSMRTKTRDLEKTFKSCADNTTCVSAHHACLRIFNLSQVEKQDCHAHCCDRDLCNFKVHKDENHYTSKQTGHGNNVNMAISLTALMTSLLLHLFSP